MENLVRNAPVDLADVFHRVEIEIGVEEIRAMPGPKVSQERIQGKRKQS